MTAFFKTRTSADGEQVWDPVRKRYVALTPEEEVRQRILAWLVELKGYPPGLISVEKQLLISGRKKRYDIVVYNQHLQPRVLIECKQAKVEIRQRTVQQAAHYNVILKVPYLMCSNGNQHFIVRVDIEQQTFEWLSDLPDFKDLHD